MAWSCVTLVVHGSTCPRARPLTRSFQPAVARCLELGLPPEEIASLAYQQSLHAKRTEVQLAFVECNRERAEALGAELADAIGAPIRPLVLAEIEAGDVRTPDLVVTTFYHLAEVRRLVRELVAENPPEVLGIVIDSHVTTLVRLNQIPSGRRIGIFYTTDEQAEAIRRSLADTGIDNVDLISGRDDPAIAYCAVVIVPSEHPEFAEEIRGKVPLLEFGNVLDAGSLRMVADLVDEIRERKGDLVNGVTAPVAQP
jgi:GntR family transcriptional regulator